MATPNKVGNIKGPKGDSGTRGSQWTTGTGAPSATITAAAIAGDMYLDVSTGDVYQFS